MLPFSAYGTRESLIIVVVTRIVAAVVHVRIVGVVVGSGAGVVVVVSVIGRRI